MNSNPVIYQIKSSFKGKIYIGSAINFNNIRNVHLCDFRKNNHGNKKLQNHYNKYGEKDFIFSILEVVDFKENLIDREQYYINTLKPYFNICKVAGSLLGTKRDKKAIEKIKNARAKQPVSRFAIEAMRLSNIGNKYSLGIKYSQERKKQISDRMTENHPMKGKKHNDESKIKMSLAKAGKPPINKGVSPSAESIEKNRLAHIGKKASEETRLKMSLARKGRPAVNKGKNHSDESKVKISLSLKGRKASSDAKLNMSIAQKNRRIVNVNG